LEPYDVVIFPQKFIHNAGELKRLYIDGLWPRNVGVGFGFSYPLKGFNSEVNFNVPGTVPIGAQ
jgi:hypothetical protein